MRLALNQLQGYSRRFGTIAISTAKQVEDILAYIYQYHGMRSKGELLMIESLDATRCRLLSYFVTIGTDETLHFPKPSTILKRGKHNIVLRRKFLLRTQGR